MGGVRGFGNGAPAPPPNLRGLACVMWGSISVNLAAGQLATNTQNDLVAAASPLPLSFYNGNLLPTPGARLVGYEVMFHFSSPGTQMIWHVSVNGVLVPAFDCIMAAGSPHASAWPAGGIVVPPAGVNWANSHFETLVPTPGNVRASSYLYFEVNAPAAPP